MFPHSNKTIEKTLRKKYSLTKNLNRKQSSNSVVSRIRNKSLKVCITLHDQRSVFQSITIYDRTVKVNILSNSQKQNELKKT